MENPEQAFVDYASSHTDEAGGHEDEDDHRKVHYSNNLSLGPEYKYDEGVCKVIQSLMKMKAIKNKGFKNPAFVYIVVDMSRKHECVERTPMEVIKNGNKVLKRTVGINEETYEPTSAEEKLDRRNEMKSRGTLLMALPNKDQLKFHSYQDAKLLMEAIEKRYGGNKESKKEVVIQQEDMNLKLLRRLPSEWKTHALIWRNKAELKTISQDDLYNNLKIYKPGLSESSNTNQNPQNMAFVSSNSTSSFNEVDTTASGVSTAHTQDTTVNWISDLKKVDPDDLEEMDLHWEIAMLTIRTGRNLDINGQRIGFDKSKVECLNCHKNGHFARECRAPKNQDNRGREFGRKTVPVETLIENALIAQDGIGSIEEPKIIMKNSFSPPIIEDWHSDDESEVEISPIVEVKIFKPSVENIKSVKTARKTIKPEESPKQHKHHPRGNQRNRNNLMSQRLGSNFKMINKASYVCCSFKHPQYDCDQRVVKQVWNNTRRVNHKNFANKFTHPHTKRRFVLQAVLTRSGKIYTAGASVTIVVRPVNIVGSKSTVNYPRLISNAIKKGHSQVTRPFNNGEARLKFKELMELCTKLSDIVLDLEKTKADQAKEIVDLKKKRSLGEEDASKQGRNLKQSNLLCLSSLCLLKVKNSIRRYCTKFHQFLKFQSGFPTLSLEWFTVDFDPAVLTGLTAVVTLAPTVLILHNMVNTACGTNLLLGNQEWKKVLKRTVGTSEETYEPTSVEEKLDRRNEMKSFPLLMDLEKVDPDDLEEMDLHWEIVMLTIRAQRFMKRTGRNLDMNGQRIGFDKSKVECFNFTKMASFQENVEPKESRQQSYQAEEEIPTNYAFMSLTSLGSSSSSKSEVDSCSNSCMKAYDNLKEQYDSLTLDYKKSQYNLLSYKAGNYMPPKHDLRLIDEHFTSVSVDVISIDAPSDVMIVKTIDVNHKGVFSIEKPKLIMKNSFSPVIIEDWHSDDESEVEISPIVEVKIVKASVEKIKSVKTARKTIKPEESPKQHKHHPRGNQRNRNNLIPVNTAGSKSTVNHPRLISNAFKRGNSQVIRPFNKEARLKLKELMELCTKLCDIVLNLEKTKTDQAKEIADLIKRVKRLKRKIRSKTLRMNLFKIGTSRRRSFGEDDASKQGRDLKHSNLLSLSSLCLLQVKNSIKQFCTKFHQFLKFQSGFPCLSLGWFTVDFEPAVLTGLAAVVILTPIVLILPNLVNIACETSHLLG
uniref:Ribonuclease H-like domain-containing protein n=1 Tax=Tanacetum cinerariifolium TaxID=118510 RepID=A0A6L2NTQ3_TANCI|nr:ribonuclease H-like domain-containing protein [Tanacetum cinerariifolium]